MTADGRVDVTTEAEHIAAIGLVVAVAHVPFSDTAAVALYALGGGIVVGAAFTALYAWEWNA